VDNLPLAQVFAEIADLLEIKGENLFKIRAYRSAADTIRAWADPVARMEEKQLLELPGIGKDLAKRIRELAETGTCRFHQDLLLEFPPTILDLLRLQGVGPKTVALLYSSLNIRSIEELVEAAKAGRLRALKGMGPKKEALILKAIEEREKDRGRHLLSDTTALAAELVSYLRERAPAADFVPVGSLRRGCETCGDIDILAAGGETSLMDHLVAFPRVERVLAQGETKTSVRITGGYQADLRLVAADSRGAAMQYFTGSKAHNVALRDRAIQYGFKLNEYGLFRIADDARVAGETEEGIYEALEMTWVPPELRENRGEIDAAVTRQLPRLVAATDLRGDLHMHTTVTDGRDDLETMAAAAQRLGYSYVAITDHSKALAMSNGLDEHRALEHAARVRALNSTLEGLTLLAGIECDVLADGTLDLADDCLAQLDVVIASVHAHYTQGEAQTTERILKALECPWVDILGHPMSRRLLQREPLKVDFDRIVSAAVAHGVALEINCQPDRLDLSDFFARTAHERGAMIAISTDAHSALALGNIRWGIQVARRAWLPPEGVLNTRPLDEMRAILRRNRRATKAGSEMT
jgi:DNA polymerase (family X)